MAKQYGGEMSADGTGWVKRKEFWVRGWSGVLTLFLTQAVVSVTRKCKLLYFFLTLRSLN